MTRWSHHGDSSADRLRGIRDTLREHLFVRSKEGELWFPMYCKKCGVGTPWPCPEAKAAKAARDEWRKARLAAIEAGGAIH